MCGRFVVAGPASGLIGLFDVDLPAAGLPDPSWNIAPGARVPIIIDTMPKGSEPDAEPVRRLEAARWGLVPPWAKDVAIGATAFIAHIESADEDPHFANAVTKRRGVVPATGYYEWRLVDGVKVPHFIHLPGNETLVFAALYEWWRNPAAADESPDKWLLSAAILTRAATGSLAGIHDRMPVFLDPSLVDEWLDPSSAGSAELLDEVAAGAAGLAESLEFHAVGPAVDDLANDSPQLAEPLGTV